MRCYYSHSGPCNSFNCLGHFKNVFVDDDDDDLAEPELTLLLKSYIDVCRTRNLSSTNCQCTSIFTNLLAINYDDCYHNVMLCNLGSGVQG